MPYHLSKIFQSGYSSLMNNTDVGKLSAQSLFDAIFSYGVKRVRVDKVEESTAGRYI